MALLCVCFGLRISERVHCAATVGRGAGGGSQTTERMAPQVGLEATTKRKRKHLQSTDGNESTSKAVVVHVN